jgi:hypothetical protein
MAKMKNDTFAQVTARADASTAVPNFTNPSQRIHEEACAKLPLNKPAF